MVSTSRRSELPDIPASPLGAFGLPEPTDAQVKRQRDQELHAFYARIARDDEWLPAVVILTIFTICRKYSPLNTPSDQMNAELIYAQLNVRASNDRRVMLDDRSPPRPEEQIQRLLHSFRDEIHAKYDPLLETEEE
jgi:hypothetical protein